MYLSIRLGRLRCARLVWLASEPLNRSLCSPIVLGDRVESEIHDGRGICGAYSVEEFALIEARHVSDDVGGELSHPGVPAAEPSPAAKSRKVGRRNLRFLPPRAN